jgi:hypothetical protein
MFRFADKVNRGSSSITVDDMKPLYEAGWDDNAIYYAITVVALFNSYNRWVDASGVHALTDEAHRQGGKRVRSTDTSASNPPARQGFDLSEYINRTVPHPGAIADRSDQTGTNEIYVQPFWGQEASGRSRREEPYM